MGEIDTALAAHAFEHLFIECLGWDRLRREVTLETPHGLVTLLGVAHKRGFPVFVASAHRTQLADRRFLRGVQKRLRKRHHEHIVIHFCETPRKQVWQWAATLDDGRRILHREHPFFSSAPPPRLLERLRGLAIPIAEEEQTSLTDVLRRVRSALLPDAELNLFAKNPYYATQSDALAMAMKRGEPGSFNQFVEFHMPLARYWGRRMRRWFDMDLEDAEQTAMIGLIEAARRFDPEKGFQFSTYAGWWIRQCCQRYGLEWGLSIHMPPYLFWPCYRLTFTRAKLVAQYGEAEAEPHFDTALAAADVTREQWDRFTAARHMDVLSDFDPRDVNNLDDPKEPDVVDQACADELRETVRGMLRYLTPRQAEIIRLRYGIDAPEHTLEQVAAKLGLTRERVRQIQVKAEERLKRRLAARMWKTADEKPREEEIAQTLPETTT
jgi:RNA polymerase sigma factor (sigma-70 family)